MAEALPTYEADGRTGQERAGCRRPRSRGPCGVGAEVAAILAEKAFGALKSPVVRLTGPDAPVAASFPLEAAFAPNAERIVEAVRKIVVQ